MVALIKIAVQLVADAAWFAILLFGSTQSVQAENLFLRRQLALFRERDVQPRRIDAATRISLAILARFFEWWTKAIVACDFFVAVAATFRLLYVFVVIEYGSRRLARAEVTAHPSADWTLQQLREVIGFDVTQRYLIRARDRIFAWHLDESIKALGLRVLKSTPRCPRANAICER